jgi:hypothetical protein
MRELACSDPEKGQKREPFEKNSRRTGVKDKNMRKNPIILAALAAAAMMAAVPAAARAEADEAAPVISPAPPTVPTVPVAPTIDGKLDDEAWQGALRFDGFKTFKPDYGKEPSQKTVFYIIHDAGNIYFAFRCLDSEPSKIKSSVCRRDAMFQDENVFMILDTFNDNQSGFTFVLNPEGIQGDGIMDVSGSLADSHDMVWFSKGTIDAEGWSVEARIPLQSIRFPAGKTLKMKVLLARFFTRTSENASYPPIDPNDSNLMAQGQSVLFTGLKYKRVAEIVPAFTYGTRSSATAGRMARDERTRDISLTGKVGLTSDMTMDGTYNPDFSQVEADAGQVDINLRYALYYPEKRPFFLEGAELWKFGGQAEDSPLEEVVYTRTIVDPAYGFRLTGKVTPHDTVAAIYARDNMPGDDMDARPDVTIARYKHSLSGDSFIGGFYTGREFGRGFNRVGGVDGRVRLNGTSVLSFHAFGSLTRPEAGAAINRDHALSLNYDYQSRKWSVQLGYQDISKDFRVDSGFLNRTGIRRLAAFAMYQIYPKSNFIQKIEPFYWSYHIYDTIYNMWETTNLFVIRIYLPRSTQVRLEGLAVNEIYAGRRFDKSGFGIRTFSQIFKQLYFTTTLRRRGMIYYDPDAPYHGYGTQLSAGLRYQPSDNLDFELDLAHQTFYRRSNREKIYDYTIVRSRNTYQVFKYLFLRGIVEYNFYQKRVTFDTLASFTYVPGTVFYIGYGSAFERLEWTGREYVSADRFLETKRGFFFKISYLWRF